MMLKGYKTRADGTVWWRPEGWGWTPLHHIGTARDRRGMVAIATAHADRIERGRPAPDDWPEVLLDRQHGQWRAVHVDRMTGKRGRITWHATRKDAVEHSQKLSWERD